MEDWSIEVSDLRCVEILKEYDDVTIYKGLWRRHQTVCVKQVQIRTPAQAALIHREISILAMCVHPHVCQYLGSANDTERNVVHIVFEYMERGNLHEYITENDHHPLSAKAKYDILLEVLLGLEYLFLRKPCCIIHRDFKPSNILLNKHGEAKIADFGVSKWVQSTTTVNSSSPSFNVMSRPQSMENMNNGNSLSSTTPPVAMMYETSREGVAGTVRWTAPELLCENRYNYLCDIYSFGLLAYFVWTDGDLPYFREFRNNGAQIGFAKSMNNRPFLQNAKLTIEQRRFVEVCTEQNTKLRPQSPGELITMLNEMDFYNGDHDNNGDHNNSGDHNNGDQNGDQTHFELSL